ncbi:MAG TPA: discoidin domain-containing protein [Verrucomicrobiales bacterium]|nr:discoidin domain-containing protein [Verrucomicrobiales bacterium]
MRVFKSPVILTFSFLSFASSAFATLISAPVNITTGTGSSATQSSTLGAQYAANNGIDGNTGNFTHTSPPEAGGANAWWQVDLGTDRTFSTIRLYNRADCCGPRLRDLTVTVMNASNGVLFTQSGINGGGALGGPAFIDVPLGSSLAGARFIKVERTPFDPNTHDGATLSLAEVTVGNIFNTLLPSGSDLTHSGIANMSVSQSSLYQGSSFPAGNAVNGVTGNSGDFTHTDSNDSSASWTVDFGEVMNLSNFIISNRVGCCPERLRDITVTVKDGLGASIYTSALLNPENALGGPADLTGSFPGGMQGRYVTISRIADPDHSGAGSFPTLDDGNVLSMSEVRIFGSSVPEPSVAMLAPLALACVLRRRR